MMGYAVCHVGKTSTIDVVNWVCIQFELRGIMDEKIRYIQGQINGVGENAHMLKGESWQNLDSFGEHQIL